MILQARYIFPVTEEPIADAAVTVQAGRIVAVGRVSPGAKIRDLGNVALLPGLVNAHTHLEFSHLSQPLGTSKMGMVDWLRAVVTLRKTSETDPVDVKVDTADAITQGLDESTRQGTTTLAEIAQPGWSAEPFERAGLDTTIFLELIGPTPERAEAAVALAEKHVKSGTTQRGSSQRVWRPGLSPHAPYTVCPELLDAAVKLSARHRVPLAMHLAESREELELIEHGRGPLADFLGSLPTWDPAVIRPGTRPIDFLHSLARAHRALVIHGNYLTDAEIHLAAEHRDRMAVVYCPRTHARFGHDPYPLEKMLQAGVTVALGTDSRASNPDLSMLAEMRWVARTYPRLSGNTILRLGTILAARALGRERQVGSLEPGKVANLTAVALDDRDVADPHELLFDSTQPVAVR